MIQEFRAFIARGNVLDLAVGVIIGAGFATIVGSLTDDIIMPVVGAVTGGMDFSNYYTLLTGSAPAGATLAAAKATGASVLAWGKFMTAIVNFLILALIIFLIVNWATRFFTATSAAPAGPTEVELLAEIRDSLKRP